MIFTAEKIYCSLFQVPCSLFMFYECNGQRCNNGEVMSSDHHVIGSGFADDVNVINVTATDFHHQSILLRNCPFHLSFRGGSNMFLVNFSVLISCNVKTKTIIEGFVMINVVDVWPATSSGGKLNLNFQSKIPPQDILLCLRDCVSGASLDQSNHGHHIVSHHQRQNIGNHVCRRRLKFERYIKLDLIQEWRFSLIMFWDYQKSIEFLVLYIPLLYLLGEIL